MTEVNYKYETHLHTYPVSRCAKTDVCEALDFYRDNGYDGVFITNHFLDGNINVDPTASYEEKIAFYFSDYEKGVKYGRKIGLKVFQGVELTYKGTDFLVYGLDKTWFLENPQIMELRKSRELEYMADNGALIIQAHPYREAGYIDHIRLFPRQVHGVEVINASGSSLENEMAGIYAEKYGLLQFAGSDNHHGRERKLLAGMCSEIAVADETHFVQLVKEGKMQTFTLNVE